MIRAEEIEFRIKPRNFILSKQLMEVIFEETLFRYLLLGLLLIYFNAVLGIMVSSVVFALVHFLKFKLKMVLVALGLGLVLGIVYACWSGAVGERIGFMVCVIIHYSLCKIGQEKGWLRRWRK